MASLLPTGKSYERLGNFPLDSSSIKSTLEEAIDYASNNPTAYHGQIVFIIDARTQDEITANIEIYCKKEEISINEIKKEAKRIYEILYDLYKRFME